MERTYIVKRDGQFYGPFYDQQAAGIFAGNGEIIALIPPREHQGEAMGRMQGHSPFGFF